jgi:hypothetical protein
VYFRAEDRAISNPLAVSGGGFGRGGGPGGGPGGFGMLAIDIGSSKGGSKRVPP